MWLRGHPNRSVFMWSERPTKSVFSLVRSLALLSVPLTFACGGDDSPTDTQDPSINVVATPTSASVEQGQSTDVSVSVAGAGGFSGTPTISLQDVPAGVTGTVGGVQTTGSTTTATLTIAVASSTNPGAYNLTVRATGNAVNPATATFALTVTEAPSYELSSSAAQVMVEQEGTGSTDIGLARTNFTAEVTLAAEGMPSGMTASFDPNPVGANASTLAVSADATVAEGTYPVTIRGTANGLDDRTVALEVVVAASFPPSYTLTMDPTSITIAQSETGTANVSLTRTNFTGSVDLSLEGAPQGVTASFDPDPVSGDVSLLTLVVESSVTPGTHELTVRGAADGMDDVTVMLSLTVSAVAGFVLEPITSLSIQQGQSQTRTVTIVRNGGFSGEVTVAVTDLPTGITASVDPVSTPGTSVDVTISVAGTVSPGAYTLTVAGSADGLPDSSQPLEVSVVAAIGIDFTLDFAQCEVVERPVWFAYRNGAAGTWTEVAGVSDTYTFSVSADEVGVAIASTPSVTESSVTALYTTTGELATISLEGLCDVVPAGKTVTASVGGLNETDDIGQLTLGDATAQAFLNGAVEFTGVPDGNLDLVGYKETTSNTADLMLLARDFEPLDGADIGSFDFATIGFSPATATMTPSGVMGSLAWEVDYVTAPATDVCYYAPLVAGFMMTSAPFTARGAPDSEMDAGDLHSVTLTGGENGLRTVSETFTSLSSDRTIDFAAALNEPVITDITGGAAYRRVRADATLPTGYNGFASIGLVDDGGERTIAVLATPAWLGGPSIALEIPDFTGAGGWDATWVPGAASITEWLFSASGTSGSECSDGYREFMTFEMGSLGS